MAKDVHIRKEKIYESGQTCVFHLMELHPCPNLNHEV